MNNYFVILAAGKSKRFNNKIPKQFFNYRNKEIIDHSIEKSLSSKLFKKILIEFLTSTKIKMNNKISKKIFEISKYCKFFSFKSTKLLSINVKKVKKPRNSVILDRIMMIIFFFKNSNINQNYNI